MGFEYYRHVHIPPDGLELELEREREIEPRRRRGAAFSCMAATSDSFGGWRVNAFGGTFRLHIDQDNHLEVATARGRMLYVFDREGRLLSSASYEPRSYSDFDGWRGSAITIPTPFYLVPFTHPFFAWATALVGMVILKLTMRRDAAPAGAPGQADGNEWDNRAAAGGWRQAASQ